MAQIVHLRHWSVHVPSVARARILPTLWLRRPLIYVEGHDGHDMEIRYRRSEWERAQNDFTRLQHSITACQKALENIPPVEPNHSSKTTKLE